MVVSDVLRDVPGVWRSAARAGSGRLTQVCICGAEGNHTLVLIDGIKASDPFDDEYDFGTIIADPDAKIEVLRGQQSALYGSDAIGGVISYTTLTGKEAPGIRINAEGGSMGTYSGGARVAGVNGDLDYALSASGLHTPMAIRSLPAAAATSASTAPAFRPSSSGRPMDNLHITAVGRYSYTKADTDDQGQDSSQPKTCGLTFDSAGRRTTSTTPSTARSGPSSTPGRTLDQRRRALRSPTRGAVSSICWTPRAGRRPAGHQAHMATTAFAIGNPTRAPTGSATTTRNKA